VARNRTEKVEGLFALLLYKVYSTWKRCPFIPGRFTRYYEKMRGKGIGKLLFDRLVQEAEGNGYSGL
jgi:GNAT superfamily N-acetyltransferase